SCQNHLLAQELAGDKMRFVDLGDGRKAAQGRTVWSGTETLNHDVSLACPSGMSAASHESFTTAPEIQAGLLGRWKNLTALNPGAAMPARAQSLQWNSEGRTVQGWLLLPEQTQGKLPMLTIVHGGPAAATVPTFRGPGLHRKLLERGYALFFPNPRGSFG